MCFVYSTATVNDLLCRQFPDSTRISHYFCEENDAKSLCAATIIGSLVRQCVTLDTLPSDAEDEIRKLFARGEPEPNQWMPLFRIVSKLAHTQFVVLDGIQECEVDVQRTVLKVLAQLASSASPLVKVFITCRGDMAKMIPKSFRSVICQAVRPTNVDADITTYVEETLLQKIEDGDLAVGSEDLVAEILRTLVNQADGM
jgi:hypothetical protein